MASDGHAIVAAIWRIWSIAAVKIAALIMLVVAVAVMVCNAVWEENNGYPSRGAYGYIPLILNAATCVMYAIILWRDERKKE